MKTNLGQIDKGIRIFLSILLVDLYLVKIISGVWGIGLLVLSAALIATSFISFCPVYNLFGISSKRKRLSAQEKNDDTRNKRPVDGQHAV